MLVFHLDQPKSGEKAVTKHRFGAPFLTTKAFAFLRAFFFPLLLSALI
jgi:hypothetical protein